MLSRLLAGLRRSPSRLESGVGVLLPSPAVLEQLRPHMPTMDGNPRNAAELVRTAVGKLSELRKSDVCAEQHCDAVRLDDSGLYRTRSHDAILTELCNKAHQLAGQYYIGRGDIASSTLLGPRGIGKSTTIRSFAAVAPFLWPRIIPIYVNYARRSAHAASLLHLVCNALREHGIDAAPDAAVLAAKLQAARKTVMLLVDEMDKLYEQPSLFTDGLWHSPQVQTLQQLAEIGDSKDGKFATILCGSSAMLMDLVTTNAKSNDDAVKMFPQLARAININGSKFREHRIFYGSPTDLHTAGQMFGCTGPASTWDAATIANVRAITFVAGTTARVVSAVAAPGLVVDAETIEGLYVANADAAQRTLLLTDAGPVWREVMTKLWFKNKALMEGLVERNWTLNKDAVRTIDWSSEFVPVDRDDKEEIADRLKIHHDDLHFRMMHLYDRDWLAFGDSRDLVYPRSMWQLVKFKQEASRQHSSADRRSEAASLSKSMTDINTGWLARRVRQSDQPVVPPTSVAVTVRGGAAVVQSSPETST